MSSDNMAVLDALNIQCKGLAARVLQLENKLIKVIEASHLRLLQLEQHAGLLQAPPQPAPLPPTAHTLATPLEPAPIQPPALPVPAVFGKATVAAPATRPGAARAPRPLAAAPVDGAPPKPPVEPKPAPPADVLDALGSLLGDFLTGLQHVGLRAQAAPAGQAPPSQPPPAPAPAPSQPPPASDDLGWLAAEGEAAPSDVAEVATTHVDHR